MLSGRARHRAAHRPNHVLQHVSTKINASRPPRPCPGTGWPGATAGNVTALAGTWGGKAGAAGPGIGLAEPIPATWEFFPGVFGHVQAPPFGVGSDPTTVNNFNGAAGIAFISGDVVRRNKRTGEVRTLPYSFNDMRFMKGVFRGRDGHERNATFAFI
jgi:hypothetical protein